MTWCYSRSPLYICSSDESYNEFPWILRIIHQVWFGHIWFIMSKMHRNKLVIPNDYKYSPRFWFKLLGRLETGGTRIQKRTLAPKQKGVRVRPQPLANSVTVGVAHKQRKAAFYVVSRNRYKYWPMLEPRRWRLLKSNTGKSTTFLNKRLQPN